MISQLLRWRVLKWGVVVSLLVMPASQGTAQPEDTVSSLPIGTAEMVTPLKAERKNTVGTEGFAHDDYARVIFHTQKTEDFTTELSGNVLTITFSHPVNVDYSATVEKLSRQIKSATMNADNTTLTFQLADDNFKVRRFAGEDFIGVDIIGDVPPVVVAMQEAGPRQPVKIAPVQMNRLTAKQSASQPEVKPQVDALLPQSILPKTESQPKVSAINKPVPLLPKELKSPTKPLIPAARARALAPSPWYDPEAEKRAFEAFIGPRLPGEMEAVVEMEMPDKKEAESDEETPVEVVDRNKITIGRDNVDGGIRLSFPWLQETPAAVFGRGRFIWVVFGAPILLDSENIKGIRFISQMSQMPHKQYTVLRIRMADGYSPVLTNDETLTPLALEVGRDGYTWLLTIQEDKNRIGSSVAHPIEIETGLRTGRASLFLPSAQAPKPLTIRDPVIGDELMIFPLAKAGNGIAPSYRFVDVTLPQTAQGMVVQPLADAISYRIAHNGVEVTGAGQLNLSPELFKSSSVGLAKKDNERARKMVLSSESVFPFKEKDKEAIAKVMDKPEPAEEKDDGHGKKKSHGEEKEETPEEHPVSAAPSQPEGRMAEEFIKRQRELFDALLAAGEDKKTDKRLQIAKFFFEEELYAEAIGVLREIKILDPIYSNMFEVDVMMAGCNFLLNRFSDAEEQFKKLAQEATGLGSYEELMLWAWASGFEANRIEQSGTTEDMPVDYLASFDKFMQHYPEELRYRFGLMAIAAKLEKDNMEAANLILSVLSSNIPQRYVNHTRFMEGVIAVKLNQVPQATKIFEELSKDIDDRYNRARATFELTKLQLLHGKITVAEAVDKFRQLTVVWRGDGFEMELLKLVGQLYINEHQYLEGLRAWTVLVQSYPNYKESIYTAGKMKKIFMELFDKGDAYKLPPKDALALFFEFRDLTPVGERGDRIIRQLVDHFVKADLLDNAAALLQHQIEYRASGEQKNALVLKLGRLHIDNNKPDKTLEALGFIDKSAASETVLNAAKYLKAEAEAKLLEYTTALATLEGDFSAPAQDIRLEVFWQQENWFGIIHILEARLNDMRETGPFPLKPEEVEDIVKLSVAYGAQEERSKLRMLKRDFEERIDSDKVRNIFGFITNDIAAINYRRFDDTVQLEEIETFMNEYAFWPGKDWQNVASVLEPQVAPYVGQTDPLSEQAIRDIVRLALAYAMLSSSSDEKQAKEAEKALARLQRDFKGVTVNRNTLNVFAVLDDKFIKMNDDAVFEGNIALKDIPSFVEQYNAARSISELNAVVKQ